MPTANRPTINAVTSQSVRVIGSLRARLLTSLVWKLWYSGFVGSVFGAISSLHTYISIFWNSSQTFRIHPLRSRRGAHLLAAACVLLSAPAQRSKGWRRRDRGRSASTGPRERRDKGSRRIDYRTHNASKDRGRDRITVGGGPTGPCLGSGRRGADLGSSVNQ